jgi:hypothetical protein
MARFLDAVITYRILKKLVTPFDQTPAFALGIIDKKGKLLKKEADLNTVEERDAYTLLDRLVFRLKRIIEKVPTDNKRLVSIAAALSLIREHASDSTEYVFLERDFISVQPTVQALAEVTDFMSGRSMMSFRMHAEDGAMANAVGAGFSAQATPNPNPNLAGRDLGLKKSRLFKRKTPNV